MNGLAEDTLFHSAVGNWYNGWRGDTGSLQGLGSLTDELTSAGESVRAEVVDGSGSRVGLVVRNISSTVHKRRLTIRPKERLDAPTRRSAGLAFHRCCLLQSPEDLLQKRAELD